MCLVVSQAANLFDSIATFEGYTTDEKYSNKYDKCNEMNLTIASRASEEIN